MTRGLLDTSLVIGLAHGDAELADPPAEIAISAVTLCELHHGVLRAGEARLAGRLAVLTYVERAFQPLPVDARIAPAYGRVMASAQRILGHRLRMADALIAATASAYGLALYTRDRDFHELPGLEIVLV